MILVTYVYWLLLHFIRFTDRYDIWENEGSAHIWPSFISVNNQVLLHAVLFVFCFILFLNEFRWPISVARKAYMTRFSMGTKCRFSSALTSNMMDIRLITLTDRKTFVLFHLSNSRTALNVAHRNFFMYLFWLLRLIFSFLSVIYTMMPWKLIFWLLVKIFWL